MDSLSDYELRKMLVEYGVHSGPVTPTTRNVLQRKLSRVMSERHGRVPESPLATVEQQQQQQSNGHSDSYTVEEACTETSYTEVCRVICICSRLLVMI